MRDEKKIRREISKELNRRNINKRAINMGLLDDLLLCDCLADVRWSLRQFDGSISPEFKRQGAAEAIAGLLGVYTPA